jgi:hypothetical protein
MLARLLRSLREDWLLYAGVATLFSPIGILIMMLQPKPPGWLLGVVAGAVSGVTALAWMACYCTVLVGTKYDIILTYILYFLFI